MKRPPERFERPYRSNAWLSCADPGELAPEVGFCRIVVPGIARQRRRSREAVRTCRWLFLASGVALTAVVAALFVSDDSQSTTRSILPAVTGPSPRPQIISRFDATRNPNNTEP